MALIESKASQWIKQGAIKNVLNELWNVTLEVMLGQFDKSPDNICGSLDMQTTSTVSKDADLGHCRDQRSQRWWDSRCNRRRLIPWSTNLSSWLHLSSGLLHQSWQLGSSRWVEGHLSSWPLEHWPDGFPQTSKNQINRPPQAATVKRTISTSLLSPPLPFRPLF